MPNFWVGGDAEKFTDPYAGQSAGAINQLSTSNFGAQAAQNAERGIGRRYQDQLESIQSNPDFGRNAAVSSRMTDLAAANAGEATAGAYQQGAKTDASARVEGAQLGLQASSNARQNDELNYQREQDASFGNSFLGHVLQSGVGAAMGVASGGLTNLIGGNTNKGVDKHGNALPGSNGQQDGTDITDVADAKFAPGHIKAIIGKDGKTYAPSANDAVIVGTNLTKSTNTKLGAGAIKLDADGDLDPAGENDGDEDDTAPVKLVGATSKTSGTLRFADMPLKLDFKTYKLGCGAFENNAS